MLPNISRRVLLLAWMRGGEKNEAERTRSLIQWLHIRIPIPGLKDPDVVNRQFRLGRQRPWVRIPSADAHMERCVADPQGLQVEGGSARVQRHEVRLSPSAEQLPAIHTVAVSPFAELVLSWRLEDPGLVLWDYLQLILTPMNPPQKEIAPGSPLHPLGDGQSVYSRTMRPPRAHLPEFVRQHRPHRVMVSKRSPVSVLVRDHRPISYIVLNEIELEPGHQGQDALQTVKAQVVSIEQMALRHSRVAHDYIVVRAIQ